MSRNTLRGDYSEIIGNSPQIFEVLQQIEHFASTSMKVLISGETGTGKELVARALHKNSGRSGELVSVNYAAIPATLLENELFGHEKGAFTSAEARRIGSFERAHKGTLFLDEIGEMPLSGQPKLLRAIEDNQIERIGGERSIPVDVRIVTATNRNLAQAVRDGTFRGDLYYRLDVAPIVLPPLSERREDIEVLVVHFLEKHCEVGKLGVLQVAASTLALLKAYPWPGNVRELENVIERGISLAKEGVLRPMHLRKNFRTYQKQSMNVSETISPPENEQSVGVPLGATLEDMEEAFVRETLAWLDGNRTEAAKVLGIGRRTLQRKLKKYNI
ncbi:sigma-54-dependent Fis family transcriptional regulator [Candidatus Poribacteria bacterium]|nr:sigma-54-dependent Fis family transcriptional regulator [Candidatus Poribacteria bacterium]